MTGSMRTGEPPTYRVWLLSSARQRTQGPPPMFGSEQTDPGPGA